MMSGVFSSLRRGGSWAEAMAGVGRGVDFTGCPDGHLSNCIPPRLPPSSESNMTTIQDQLLADMKEAMKAKDQIALGAIRGLKTAFMNVCVEKGLGPQGVLPEGEAIAVVRKQIKQRQDSVESFTTGGRPELAEKETAEIAVLEKYLPAALSAAEVDALVAAVIQEVGATSKKEMGAVMKLLNERAAGRIDGKTLSTAVNAKLG